MWTIKWVLSQRQAAGAVLRRESAAEKMVRGERQKEKKEVRSEAEEKV